MHPNRHAGTPISNILRFLQAAFFGSIGSKEGSGALFQNPIRQIRTEAIGIEATSETNPPTISAAQAGEEVGREVASKTLVFAAFQEVVTNAPSGSPT